MPKSAFVASTSSKVGLLASVCLASLVVSACKSRAEGIFEANGGVLGEWTFRPTSCRSGENEGFFGVWLLRKGDEEHAIRIAREPATGRTVLSVLIPGTKEILVLDDCDTPNSSIVRTNAKVNEIWAVDGWVQIDCPDEYFKGNASFENCH